MTSHRAWVLSLVLAACSVDQLTEESEESAGPKANDPLWALPATARFLDALSTSLHGYMDLADEHRDFATGHLGTSLMLSAQEARIYRQTLGDILAYGG